MLWFDQVTDFVYFIGILYVCKHVYDIALGVYIHFIRNKIFEKINLKKRYGQWAVVTGGSDGLGECYCRELASRGLNLVLISEKLERLKSVSQQLESEFRIQAKYIHADLRGGKEVYDDIAKELEGLDIGILVNNAGVLVPPMAVEEMSHDQTMNFVLVNIAAPTLMCKIVLPSMKERGRGAIVNIASVTEIGGTPYFAAYAASKAYVRSISEALQFECKDHNIDVQCITPCFLRTGMTSFSDVISNYLSSDPTYFVSSAVETLGVCDKTAGTFLHDTQHFMFRVIPTKVYSTCAGYVLLFIKGKSQAK